MGTVTFQEILRANLLGVEEGLVRDRRPRFRYRTR